MILGSQYHLEHMYPAIPEQMGLRLTDDVGFES
jgi:hypothetical protein